MNSVCELGRWGKRHIIYKGPQTEQGGRGRKKKCRQIIIISGYSRAAVAHTHTLINQSIRRMTHRHLLPDPYTRPICPSPKPNTTQCHAAAPSLFALGSIGDRWTCVCSNHGPALRGVPPPSTHHQPTTPSGHRQANWS